MERKKKRVTTRTLIISLVVVVILAIAFVVTQFLVAQQPPTTKFEDLTPQERLQNVTTDVNITFDRNHYQAAILANNRNYCNLIQDSALKEKCISETPVPNDSQSIVVNQLPPEQQADENHYNIAIANKDKAYCDLINDIALKQKCYQDIQASASNIPPTTNTGTCDSFTDPVQKQQCLDGLLI